MKNNILKRYLPLRTAEEGLRVKCLITARPLSPFCKLFHEESTEVFSLERDDIRSNGNLQLCSLMDFKYEVIKVST